MNRRVLLLAGIATACGGTKPPSTTTFGHLVGLVRTSIPSCGAQVPDWGPAPYPGASLLVRTGRENSDIAPVVKITADARGRFDVALAPGTYCLVFGNKPSRPMAGTQYADLSCLVDDWRRCAAIADVSARTQVEVIIDNPATCFGPCYHGPPPQ